MSNKQSRNEEHGIWDHLCKISFVSKETCVFSSEGLWTDSWTSIFLSVLLVFSRLPLAAPLGLGDGTPPLNKLKLARFFLAFFSASLRDRVS